MPKKGWACWITAGAAWRRATRCRQGSGRSACGRRKGWGCLTCLTAAELQTTAGSDPRKVAIAKVVHERTAVTRRWTAGRLKMKSAVNVCQHIRRLKTGKLNLTKEAKQFLSTIEP